ncbi:MAG: ABC transporter six-transmembrane domain-containing protein [Devosia sp.]
MTLTEEALDLLHPAAMGWAVNGLLNGRDLGLGAFGEPYPTHVGVSVARQWHDSRSYDRIYADVAMDVVERQRRQGPRTARYSRRLNDRFEREGPAITRGRPLWSETPPPVRHGMACEAVDLEAGSWGAMQLLMAALGVVVLIRATGLSGVDAGTIFAIVAYCWKLRWPSTMCPGLWSKPASDATSASG